MQEVWQWAQEHQKGVGEAGLLLCVCARAHACMCVTTKAGGGSLSNFCGTLLSVGKQPGEILRCERRLGSNLRRVDGASQREGEVAPRLQSASQYQDDFPLQQRNWHRERTLNDQTYFWAGSHGARGAHGVRTRGVCVLRLNLPLCTAWQR